MIALTAGEPPLEVPRTPFALFCSSIKRKKSAKKNMSELQRLIRANGIMLFLGLYHFPLSIRFFFGGGEWRGW